MWDTMLFTPTTGFKDNNQTSYVIVYKASPHNAIVLDHLRPISVHRPPTITSIINEKTSNTEQRAHEITPKLRRCLFKDSHLHRSFEEFYNIQLVSRSRKRLAQGLLCFRTARSSVRRVMVATRAGSLPGISELRSLVDGHTQCALRTSHIMYIILCIRDVAVII